MHRREFLGALAASGLASRLEARSRVGEQPAAAAAVSAGAPTRFQYACMTLPYAAFPLDRALTGIRAAGYDHVAWGVTHKDTGGQQRPAMDVAAPPSEAAALARRCRDLGLTPVMMFSTVFLEEPNATDDHRRRIAQAAAAGIPYLLTFGRTRPGEYERVVACLKAIGPDARKAGVTVLIKQHGGNTATGAMCARIIREVGDEGVRMCYDAGNVLDYESHDPIADIATCVGDVRAFAIKDHRDWPKDEDCGPGFGEIDHYRLLQPVMRTGLTMPLVFENIFEPLVPRPSTPEGIDALARRAREYVQSVIGGLQAQAARPA
ncbi:sugar phosphate isomerase/epimerase [Luteitalea sp. TBR-22]|uniref:sugar phosphate isomerase/epimerase family protein n=1 Tax=Luteitalea sp. TBR-22 TaxID=2802971 RepID=UPI001EF5F1C6|nr:TIM barrel protein [Luteitalea sp. TBR-22]